MLIYEEEPEWTKTKKIIYVLQRTNKNNVSLLSILHLPTYYFSYWNVEPVYISNITEANHNMKQTLEDVHRWPRAF